MTSLDFQGRMFVESLHLGVSYHELTVRVQPAVRGRHMMCIMLIRASTKGEAND